MGHFTHCMWRSKLSHTWRLRWFWSYTWWTWIWYKKGWRNNSECVLLQTLQLQTPSSRQWFIHISLTAQVALVKKFTISPQNVPTIEECSHQYKLLVGVFKLSARLKFAKSHKTKRWIWKLKRPDVRIEYNMSRSLPQALKGSM